MTVTMRENTKRARKIKSHSHEVRTTQIYISSFPGYSNSKPDPYICSISAVYL